MKRLILFLFIPVLFACKSTKKTISLQESLSKEIVQEKENIQEKIEDRKDLSEITTKRIITRDVPITTQSGEVIITKEQVVEEVREKYDKGTETIVRDISKDVITQKDTTSVTAELNKETEGQEVVKDISKGIFEAIFGNYLKHIATAIGIIILIVTIKKLNVFGDKKQKEEGIHKPFNDDEGRKD